jgi:hypothetical protein
VLNSGRQVLGIIDVKTESSVLSGNELLAGGFGNDKFDGGAGVDRIYEWNLGRATLTDARFDSSRPLGE